MNYYTNNTNTNSNNIRRNSRTNSITSIINSKENSLISEMMNNLTLLNLEKIKLVEQGKYIEAEKLKRKINELKNNLDRHNKKTIDSQHEVESNGLNEEYEKEITEFEVSWDQKFKTLQETEDIEEELLTDNHNNELKELSVYIEETMPKIIFLKHSSEYLELRQVEMNLVKQERFIEAHMVRLKADLILEEEEEKFHKEKENLIKIKVDKLVKKYHLERRAMKEKFIIQYEILKKDKDLNLELINHKYRNKREWLENQQKSLNFLSQNSNIMKAKTLSNVYREKQLYINMNRNKSDFNRNDPEAKMKALRNFHLKYTSID